MPSLDLRFSKSCTCACISQNMFHRTLILFAVYRKDSIFKQKVNYVTLGLQVWMVHLLTSSKSSMCPVRCACCIGREIRQGFTARHVLLAVLSGWSTAQLISLMRQHIKNPAMSSHVCTNGRHSWALAREAPLATSSAFLILLQGFLHGTN